MDPATIMAISELVKLAVTSIMSYARQAGLSDEQIEAAFQAAKAGLNERDPNKIPTG